MGVSQPAPDFGGLGGQFGPQLSPRGMGQGGHGGQEEDFGDRMEAEELSPNRQRRRPSVS